MFCFYSDMKEITFIKCVETIQFIPHIPPFVHAFDQRLFFSTRSISMALPLLKRGMPLLHWYCVTMAGCISTQRCEIWFCFFLFIYILFQVRPSEPHHIVELFSEGPPASIECWGHAPDDIYWDDHPYFPWEPGMFSELVLLVKHFTTQRWNSWNWNSCPVIERMKAVMEEVRTLSYLPFDDLTKWHNICLAVSTLAPHIQYWCLFSVSLPSHADPSRSNRRCFVVHHMIWNLVLMLPKVVMYAGSTTTFGVVRFCLEDVTNYLINYFAKLAPPKIFPSPVVPLHRSGRVNVWIAPCCPSRGAIHTAKSTTQIWPLQPITSFLINAPT